MMNQLNDTNSDNYIEFDQIHIFIRKNNIKTSKYGQNAAVLCYVLIKDNKNVKIIDI